MLKLATKKTIGIIICLVVVIAVIYLVNKNKNCFMKESNIETVFGKGETNPYGRFFTGQTYLQPMVNGDDIFNSNIANVTFEPSARTNWHSHTNGQILLVLDGNGFYQEKGKEAQFLKKGDVVKIPPQIVHWHGAAKHSWFVHISITPDADNNKTTWLEVVNDEDYNKACKSKL